MKSICVFCGGNHSITRLVVTSSIPKGFEGDGDDEWTRFYRNRIIDPEAVARWKKVVEEDKARREAWWERMRANDRLA